MNRELDIPVVAIVGGGYTGAVLAWHLARGMKGTPLRIVVVEPRERLGAGLAYSTAEPSHRINVPASRITMRSDVKNDFQRWIEERGIALSPGSTAPDGALYPQRGLVADYVGEALREDLSTGRIVHRRCRATDLARNGRFDIGLDDGDRIEADHLVIATSHPPPECPAEFSHLKNDSRVVTDPSDARAIAEVARSAGPVLVLGTGLTSADVIASLDHEGYRGRVTALSRRGLRSRGHASNYPASEADFATDPARTALDLLRDVRAAVRADEARGLPWQATLDRVRADGPAIWAALPPGERARFVRRLRVWWDVHRFRVAPQVEAVLDRMIADDRLAIRAGRLSGAETDGDALAVSWTERGGGHRRHRFEKAILTTGPGHRSIVESSRVLACASRLGLVRADRLGLGLAVSEDGQAIGDSGSAVPGLWVAGPLARGTVGELMGIPEVTLHAERIAAHVTRSLATRQR